MVKILSYKIEGNMIRVATDDPARPEFVYDKQRFVSKDALLKEIEKSIIKSKRITEKKEANFSKLKAELDAIKP